MFIIGRGKDDYLYGDITVPSPTDPRFRQWRSENSMIMSWLISSMTPEIGENFMLYTTAAEIWKAARELYSKRDNVAEIYELEAKLQDVRQGENSVSTYYSQLTKLWQQIDIFETIAWTTTADEALFKKFLETKRVFRFLNGLNKNLDSVRSRILGTKPLPTLNSVFSEIRHEESRIKVMMGPQQGSALEGSALASHVTNSSGSSQQVDSTGLVVRRGSGGGSFNKNKSRTSQLICKFCKKSGHRVEDCFKLQRLKEYQQQHPGAKFVPTARMPPAWGQQQNSHSHPQFTPNWGPSTGAVANTTNSTGNPESQMPTQDQMAALLLFLSKKSLIGESQSSVAEFATPEHMQATMATTENYMEDDWQC